MGSTKNTKCKIDEWSERAIDNIEIPTGIAKIHALVIAPGNQRKRYALISSAVVEDVYGKPHLFVLIAPYERKIEEPHQKIEGGGNEKKDRLGRD